MARKLPTIESTIDSVLKSGKGYPDADWLASYRGIGVNEAYDIMMKHYMASDFSIDPPIRPKVIELPPEPAKEPQKQSFVHRVHDVPKEALKVIFGLLSLLCAVRSWGFIYGWFERSSDSFAWVMATVLTGALIAMPQAMVYAWKEKRKAIVAFTALVTVVSVLFAMVTTTGGLYNDRSQSLVSSGEASLADQKNREIISSIQESIEQEQQTVNNDRNELQILMANIAKYEVGSYEYNRTVTRIDVTKTRIEVSTKKIEQLKVKKESLIVVTNTVVERDDFYKFLENVTGLRKEEIEFLISIIVSIIVDIVGPLFATLALFL